MKKKTRDFWEGLGHWFFYVTLRLFGHRGGRILLVFVVSIYLLFSRKIHRLTKPYLNRRFPESNPVRRFGHCWKLVYSFGIVLVDRAWLGIKEDAEFGGMFSALDQQIVFDLLAEKKGLVLLIAHVGPWQSAWAWLGRLPKKVYAVMEYHQDEVGKHYFDLGKRQRPIEIIDVKGAFGGMVEAAAALNRGEVVTIMGDRYVKGPFVTVQFFGKSVRLPAAAYALAASSGAPLAVLFAAKTGAKRAEVRVHDVWRIEKGKESRLELAEKYGSRFSQALESYLSKYPYQWYNFYDFWKQ